MDELNHGAIFKEIQPKRSQRRRRFCKPSISHHGVRIEAKARAHASGEGAVHNLKCKQREEYASTQSHGWRNVHFTHAAHIQE